MRCVTAKQLAIETSVNLNCTLSLNASAISNNFRTFTVEWFLGSNDMSIRAVTSTRVAKIASTVLKGKNEDAKAKSAAGSALVQTPNHPKKLILKIHCRQK